MGTKQRQEQAQKLKQKRKLKTSRSRAALTPGPRFVRNALWLVAVNLFMRTVGVGFNLRISARAGGEVMGLYALLGGVYGLFLTLGCGSVHLGTTRLVAEVCARGTPGGGDAARGTTGGGDAVRGTTGDGDASSVRDPLRRCLARCLSYALICGTAAGILLFAAAPWIGRVWLGDARTVPSLRVMALSLPPVALANALGGYFTAVRRVGSQSVGGVLTQFCRLFLCVALMAHSLPRGAEAACTALTLGGALSEGIGLCLSLTAFLIDRRRHPEGAAALSEETPAAPTQGTDSSDAPTSLPSPASAPDDHTLTSRLLGITLPVTLAACLRSGLVTLEHALIPRGLRKSGASWASALASYGLLHSLVLPVVLFPSAFISSFSGLLVPEAAEARTRGGTARAARIAERVITPALLFSFGAAGIMSALAYELGEIICGSAEAGRLIRLLAPLIPIMYVDSPTDALLKGMGEQVWSMVVNIIDALCSVLLVVLLLPRMGLDGFIVTIYFTETLNTALSFARMLTVTRMPVRLWRMVGAPLLSVVGAASTVRLALAVLPDTLTGLAGLIVHTLAIAALYVLFLFLTGALRSKPLSYRKAPV